MRPIKEYLPPTPETEFQKDIASLSKEERTPIVAQYNMAVEVWKARPRIEKFLKARGTCSKIDFIRGLNIRKSRLDPVTAVGVLNTLLEENLIETKVGDSGPKGGRRGVLIVWREKKPPLTEAQIQAIMKRCPPDAPGKISDHEPAAIMPNAILEEVAEDPRSQELVAAPKISLDKPADVCEDDQVAEFRKNELADEPKPVSEPKAQKIRRSALLEGLSS